MAKLRNVAPEHNGLVTSLVRRTTEKGLAEKGLAGDWQRRAVSIVHDKVYPALDRQMALYRRLRAKSPAGDGIWRLKQGDAIYAAALGAATTTTLTPEAIHKIGLEQVAQISAELDTVLKAAGHTTGSIGARLSALNHAPEQLYPDTAEGRAQLIAGLNQSVAHMRTQLPRAFADIPNDPLTIRAVPVEIQDGAPNGYYNSASLDGSRPAIYWINLKSVGDWPKYSLPSLTYHEGIPGHHLQGGYAQGVESCRGFCATTSSRPMARAGRSMPNNWAMNWAAIRASNGRAIFSRSCSARCVWWSIPASTTIAGAARRRRPTWSRRPASPRRAASARSSAIAR
jgi:uncharacterized protein (DUF885 family)